MPSPAERRADFATTVAERLLVRAERGEFTAADWMVDGPHMPMTTVNGVATEFTLRMGESEVTLRWCDIFPSHSNNDWRYTVTVRRGEQVIGLAVTDDHRSAAGRLIGRVVDLCEPTLEAERRAAAADLGL